MSWNRTLSARQPTVLNVTRTWMCPLGVGLAGRGRLDRGGVGGLDREVASRDGHAVAQEASAVPSTWLPANAPPAASVCATVVELSSATSRAASSARTVMSRPLMRAATTEASAAPRTSLRATTP